MARIGGSSGATDEVIFFQNISSYPVIEVSPIDFLFKACCMGVLGLMELEERFSLQLKVSFSF